MDDIIVKRQTEVGSTNWGVYINEALREGGFFTKGAAEQCADNWRSEIAAEMKQQAMDTQETVYNNGVE